MKKRIKQWEAKLEKLSNRRENNVNRYIIPIELEMSELRDKIREAKEILIEGCRDGLGGWSASD